MALDKNRPKKPTGIGLLIYRYFRSWRELSHDTGIHFSALNRHANWGDEIKMTRLADGTMIGWEEFQRRIREAFHQKGANTEELDCLFRPLSEAEKRVGRGAPAVSVSGDSIKEDFITKYLGGLSMDLQTQEFWGLADNPFNPYEADAVDDFWAHPDYVRVFKRMVEEGKRGGFLAVIGPVGSGKTTCAERAMVDLEDDGVEVIQPACRAVKRVTPTVIDDAILDRLSATYQFSDSEEGKQPPSGGEYKSWLVKRVLSRHTENGGRTVLFVEEAHLMKEETLKHLKHLWESRLRVGRKHHRLLAIVMVGQEELSKRLHNIDATREVGIRVHDLEVKTIPQVDVNDYLDFKLKKAGLSWRKVCDPALQEEIAFGLPAAHLTPQRLNRLAEGLLKSGAENGMGRLTLELYFDMLQSAGVAETHLRKMRSDNRKRNKIEESINVKTA